MTNSKLPINKVIFLGILFLAAFIERVIFDLGPNVELITMALILSSFYFGKKESFWLTFAIIATSDAILGNSNIFLFTWSGFLIPALFASSLIKKLITNHKSQITKKIFDAFSLTAFGLSSNIFFYFWTNFGVWLIGNLYPHTSYGLLMSYINAIPFLRYQLTSTLIFVPLGLILTEIAIYLLKNYQARIRVSLVK
ncbi:hypothetical protein A2714_04355 [Candidatus Woesebacteria bacterium RIFCSPHIGHO2_01_FULL_38_9]|uniref:Rod shape-determining protein MreD n=2 Tax=Candidatus Woeseibacteriota TaxID=1752722 RepID=A0A1F7XZ14_9BACT|nr:MAG: hypothetical protein A2714_04355 [Candidatus Woesebacteria bacterium RIFCSPHIGHO2_01_FULL_38_9]OGM58956.1 MAG: hypothetical protein A3A75_00370 [Candidatus Woesebacteria bacterium RIFCSPLOWO2_01_FULL_39_10]